MKGNRIKGKNRFCYKHGMSYTKIHAIWRNIIGRCINKKNKSYKNYGARGISICNEWTGENGFVNFYKYVGNKPKNLSIDRIDNNGNYEPGNVRWADSSIQSINRRKKSGSYSKYKGVTYNIVHRKWVATVYFKGEMLNGGNFKTEKEAAIIANKISKKLHGKYAFFNNIEN